MLQNDIIIRKVTRSDVDGLVKLYEEVWPDTDYNKKDKANFILNESTGVSYCAELDGQLVGSRTSFFQNLFWGEKRLKSVQVGDSCVHSSCRGKGLFTKMNQAFLKDFFSTDVAGELIFNISVYASRKAYEKLGWHYIESLMAMRKFPHPLQTMWRAKMNPRNLGTPIVWNKENVVKDLDEELLQKREQKFQERICLHIKYDANTFKWRLKSKNGIKVFTNALGAIVYKTGNRGKLIEILVGEVFLYSYSLNNLRRIIKSLAATIRPDIISVWVSEGHPLKS